MDQFRGITFLTMSQSMLLLLGMGLRTNASSEIILLISSQNFCHFTPTKFVVSIVGGGRSLFGLHVIVDMLQGTD